MSTPSTRTPPARCSRCDQVLDAVSKAEGEGTPQPGDISMCLYCGALHLFTKRLKLRRMTFGEIAELEPDTRALLRRMQRAQRISSHLKRLVLERV